MDIGNLIYIVAIIGYFIYQMTRKKVGQEQREEPNETPAPRQKPSSFEELMREIRDAQRPAPEPAPQPVRTAAPIQKIKKPSRAYSEEAEDEEIRYYEGSYENSDREKYQLNRDVHSTIAFPTPKIDYDALNSRKVNPYGALLKNPKTLREAVIVSEILKRKHF